MFTKILSDILDLRKSTTYILCLRELPKEEYQSTGRLSETNTLKWGRHCVSARVLKYVTS